MLFSACNNPQTRSSPVTTTLGGQASSTSTTLPAIEIRKFSAKLGCGPSDGAWIYMEVELGTAQTVFAEVSQDGRSYGRSKNTRAEADSLIRLGFDPAVENTSDPNLRVTLFSIDGRTTRNLGERTVEPHPPDRKCG